MKKLNTLILSASAGLAAALISGLPGAALAQGEDEIEISASEEEEGEEIDCSDEADCVEEDVVYEDDAGLVLPPSGTTADDAAPAETETSGEPVLITPGSTEESNPGGSTRPGTTPDN